eukprot:scaffold46736_cov60-Phaeocystis_antarctica.AAC.3
MRAPSGGCTVDSIATDVPAGEIGLRFLEQISAPCCSSAHICMDASNAQKKRKLRKTPLVRPERDGPYLLVRVPVRPEHDRAQSCAIALRSPASERPSDLNRNSPKFTLAPLAF